MPAPAADTQAERDAAALGALGYRQELRRSVGGFGNFALSCSIISVLTGAVTLYGHGLLNGGPLVMSLGWWLVTLGTLPVALSLAQLASSFPTAGALYHWATLLGGPGWGFATAWLNTIGQFAITAGIDFGLAEFLAPMLGLPEDRATKLAICAALLVGHGMLNHLGVRVVNVLNWLSAWVHLLGVVAIVLALAWLAPHKPLNFLLTRWTQDARGYGWGFAIGLLQAQWTYTGYDASAHVTEETIDPSRNAPRGIVLAVVVSAIAGSLLLCAVTLAIGDVALTRKASNPFIFILQTSLGDTLGGALVWVAMAAMWFCGLGSVTSNSRMLFAFARDGGVPFATSIARVSPRFQSPHTAIWLSCAMAFAVALWADAYAAMVALSTIALYASYGLPIALGWQARRTGRWRRRGPWDLGRWSSAVNLAAIAWVSGVLVLFVLPPNQLAGYAFAGCCLWLIAYWFAFRRGHFSPPIRDHGA